MTSPLSGVRVIAVEQYGAGPFGTQHLADLGAEVIKVENPGDGGDVGRHVGPHFFEKGVSHFFQSFNRNKKSPTLNLKMPEGMEILREPARQSDAVFNNLRGDLPERLSATGRPCGNPWARWDLGVRLSVLGRSAERPLRLRLLHVVPGNRDPRPVSCRLRFRRLPRGADDSRSARTACLCEKRDDRWLHVDGVDQGSGFSGGVRHEAALAFAAVIPGCSSKRKPATISVRRRSMASASASASTRPCGASARRT